MGILKRIHVNQHNIRANKKDPAMNLPVLTIKTSRGNTKGYEVAIDGPSTLVYHPDHPLPCGARVWLETRAPVGVRVDNLPDQRAWLVL